MHDENTIVRERQRLIRREMIRRGISIKAVQMDGGWDHPSTVLSYFPNPDSDEEPKTMSVASLYRLISTEALPPDLLSMLLPDGFLIVRAPETADYDQISAACRDFIDTKDRAHHPESEAGRDLGPGERGDLGCKVIEIRGRVA